MINLATDLKWTLHKLQALPAKTPFANADALSTWAGVPVPGTVALAIGESLAPAEDLDDFDWVYTAPLHAIDKKDFSRIVFSGLATFAEVWIDGECVLCADNMFTEYQLDLSATPQKLHNICIIFRSLNRVLQVKRPRPRWKTNLIDNQQLRWVRTTLLGHIPGWTPPIKPIGPWREIAVYAESPQLLSVSVKTSLATVEVGEINVEALVCFAEPLPSLNAHLEVEGVSYPLAISSASRDNEYLLSQSVAIKNPTLWWPHTHGTPNRYHYKIVVTIGDAEHCIKAGQVGFRQVDIKRDHDKVEIFVNDISIFCRGACWTTPDIVSLSSDKAGYSKLLMLARDAGANMLRVGGTMVYEHDDFYETCDELGLLVWQDFMFANMDYPFDDKHFAESVNLEVQQQTRRLSQFASVVVFCGGSEVQQQAAMFGLPPDAWASEFFDESLVQSVKNVDPQLGYFPSSPCEGALPFHNNKGIAHYFGVGAYQRDFTDLVVADVKFAAECLAFANFPGEASRKHFFASPNPQPHHPKWKAGVCRDNGAGWDFADVTDFYLEKVFSLNAYELRYENLERYHQLSEWVTGYVISRVYHYWRSSHSNCSGGIIWFYNDIVAGAGWGLVDKNREAKPAMHLVKQAWQSIQVVLVDTGLNGIALEVINESAQNFTGKCFVNLLRADGEIVKTVDVDVVVVSRGCVNYSVDQLLGGFNDTTHSYRFGPARHSLMVGHLRDSNDRFVSQATMLQSTLVDLPSSLLDVQTHLVTVDNQFYLGIESNRFLLGANLTLKNLDCGMNYIDLVPGQQYLIPVFGVDAGGKYRSSLLAINGGATFTLTAP